MQEYTAVVRRAGHRWIGWIADVPGVNCQEHTSEKLLGGLDYHAKRGAGLQSLGGAGRGG